jgi:hypothetical protein
MGLDMYLEVRKFVPAKNYKMVDGDYEREFNRDYLEVLTASKLTGLASDDGVGLSVTSTAIYWRKVNSIHNWFISKCANGVDECQPVYVSREQLEMLLETVSEVIDKKDASALPPASGFFFGSPNVDEWYWKDLAFTKRELKSVLNKTKTEDVSFIYQASW